MSNVKRLPKLLVAVALMVAAYALYARMGFLSKEEDGRRAECTARHGSLITLRAGQESVCVQGVPKGAD